MVSQPGTQSATFWSGDSRLLVDFASRSVFIDGDEIHLTPTEFDVLACLARRAGTVVTTAELVDAVWGEWYGPMDHVFVHVHHIRRKLGPCARLIVTKRKAGYLLRLETADGSDTEVSSSVQAEYLEMLQQDAHARGIIWLIVGASRRLEWVSDSVFSLLGWSPKDLVGRLPWVIAHDEESEGFAARFPLEGAESLLSFDTRLKHLDGRVMPIRVAAQVLRGIDGDLTGGLEEWSSGVSSGPEPSGLT